jgi:hypothetical protein
MAQQIQGLCHYKLGLIVPNIGRVSTAAADNGTLCVTVTLQFYEIRAVTVAIGR